MDNKGVAAEVVETMQNAIAILPVPLAPVQPAQPESAQPTQDFTEAFAAELLELGGDVPVVDPPLVAADPTVSWVIPVPPAPSILPVGLKAAFGAGKVMDDPALSADAATQKPDQGQVEGLAIEPITEPVDRGEASKSVDDGKVLSKADVVTRHASDDSAAIDTTYAETARHPEKVAADPVAFGKVQVDAKSKPDLVTSVGLAGIMPPAGVEAKAQAKGLPAPPTAKQSVAAAIPHAPRTDEPNAPVVKHVAGTEAESLGPDPLSPKASPGAERPAVKPIDAPPVVTLPSANLSDWPRPDRLMGVKTAPALEPEVPKAISVPSVEAEVTTAMTATATFPSETPRQEPLALSGFWERYFANSSAAQSGPKLVADQVLPTAASPVPGVSGPTPLLWAEQKAMEDVPHPFDKMTALSEAEVSDGAEVALPEPLAASNPLSNLWSRPDLVPVMTFLPWSEGTADRGASLDPALSSLSSFSSGATLSASAGAGGSASFPVQHVAAQLAGVLVQTSDRVTELALSPEELGKVRLRMEVDATNSDRLTILIHVERPETLDLFRRHAGDLAEAIRNAGYSGAQIDFGQQGRSGGSEQQPGHAPMGSDLATEEIAPIQHSPRIMAGATLDLRL